MTTEMRKNIRVIDGLQQVTDAEVDVLGAYSDLELELSVAPSDVHYSTGMVSIQSGRISLNDISRALDAAMNMHSFDKKLFLPVISEILFRVDDKIEITTMPVGIAGRVLEAKLAMVRLPSSNTIWQQLHKAQGNITVRWVIAGDGQP